jgi:hydrogenase nickel incorporation protein HypA/HybF
MHEVGLMQDTIDLATTAAREAGAERIHRIRLRIGRLAGVEAEAMRFAFAAVTQGTLADGAVLDIDPVEVVCHCRACDRPFTPTDYIFACPWCAAITSDVRQGREIELVAVEVSCGRTD